MDKKQKNVRFRTQPANIISKWVDESNLGDEYRRIVYYYYLFCKRKLLP